MNEIEFRDDKLRAVNAGGAPQPGDNNLDDNEVPEEEMIAPQFAQKPQSQKLIEGSTVRFDCLAYGYPAPRVRDNPFHFFISFI